MFFFRGLKKDLDLMRKSQEIIISILEDKIMPAIDALKAANDKLIADVTAETTVDSAILTMITGMNAQQKILTDELNTAISANGNASTDPDIMAAAKAITDQAALIEANTAKLQDAVTAGTPASTVVPNVPIVPSA
jgi:hypothetical protein